MRNQFEKVLHDLDEIFCGHVLLTKILCKKFVVETMEVPLPSHNYYHHHHHNNYYHKQQHHKHMGGPLKVPHLRHHHVSHRGPYFENVEGQEINGSEKVVHLGDTAFLDCRVVMLSGKMVMWIRQYPDKALLTVGKNTHIADDRYSVSFKYPNNWRLMITSIQKEDRGLYVCQVNTHPPRMLVTNVTILGEKQAAVHHDQWNTALRLDQNLYVTFISVFLICYQRIVKILFIKC
ncbi:hypothetical protein TKK_0002082 [Trichogramma kaykai]